MSETVLELTAVTKKYGALRPLRIEQLAVSRGDHVALLGLDQPAAEVLINLVTGAGLPDEGTVVAFDRSTAAIADSADWFATLDRFGIVSERAAFLESLTLVQNLAVPFSLEIEPPPREIRDKVVGLARDAGFGDEQLDRPLRDLDATARLRARVARALALNPALIVLEHPSVNLARGDVKGVAHEIRALCDRRQVATLTLTRDEEYAAAAARRVLTVTLATGRVSEKAASRFGFWKR